MHNTTGLVLLKYLVTQGLLTLKGQNFVLPPYPRPVHMNDVKEAFIAVADAAGHDKKDLEFLTGYGMIVHAKARLFDRIYKVLFLNEKTMPGVIEENMGRGEQLLPTLFVNSEKTQIRQIPLVNTEPYPFRFLMELGGMIVVRTNDEGELKSQLTQYIANFPQIECRVMMKRWPDGSYAMFTWFFRVLETTRG